MAKRRVVLTYPAEQVEKPVVYHLVKDYDLVTNILRAEIEPPEIGRMLVELSGDKAAIERGLEWVVSIGVAVEDAARDIILEVDACVDCGACTAVCVPGALKLDPKTRELKFDKSRCTFCRSCVTACPLGLFSIKF